MTTMRVVGECFFWYRLTRVFPDRFHRAVKRLCVTMVSDCCCWLVCAVDASDAGLGDLDIDVICKDARIPTQSQVIGRAHTRYTFIPMSPHNHLVNVKYNFDDVPGTLSTTYLPVSVLCVAIMSYSLK